MSMTNKDFRARARIGTQLAVAAAAGEAKGRATRQKAPR